MLALRASLALLLCASLWAPPSRAAVSLPHFYGNDMVLQTNAEYGARSFINGFADPNEAVTVQVGKTTLNTVADANGDWIVQLDPLHGTMDITVSGASGPAVTLQRVAAGDVFFCSGQSNMVFPVKLTDNATAEIASADDPAYRSFRLLTLPMVYNTTGEQMDIPPTPWLTLNSSTIPDFSAVCFMTAKNIADLHTSSRPIGLIFSAWGGTRIEAWSSQSAVKRCTDQGHVIPPAKAQQTPSALWNTMVAPLSRFSIRAALWYQGEANADQKFASAEKTAYYSCFLQSMIADWRLRKHMGDFAFMTMQLPPSQAASGPATAETGRMEVRIAQSQSVPHPFGETDISGIAVTLDLGGKSAWGFDHPPNKNEMSWRLALATLHTAYAVQGRVTSKKRGETGLTGPVFQAATAQGNDVSVSFQATVAAPTASGLFFKNVPNCTTCCSGTTSDNVRFETSADGTTWKPAPASVKGETVVLSGAGQDKLVRYAWTDFVQCVLVNNDSLPLGPFLSNITAASPAETAQPGRAAKQAAPAPGIQAPPMGTNSWNAVHCNVDENYLYGTAQAMVDRGLTKAGYSYVNVDDCWQVERSSNGTITPDPVRFPSGLKAVSDKLHTMGVKFGLYTARGSRTCQSRPGAYPHEVQDADTYCDWGLDYLKIDNCGGATREPLNASWILFHEEFAKCQARTGRFTVQSVEYCRDPSPTGCGGWIANVANLWRTTGDIQANWGSMISNAHSNNAMADIARPGAFNDPDMLQVGNVGMSVTEQQTHHSLWTIMSAPLLIGTDLAAASQETIDILTAPGPLSVDQDLGVGGRIQGRVVNATDAQGKAMAASSSAATEVWAKHLSTGNVAALLLNLQAVAAPVTAHATDLGLDPSATLQYHDLWTGKQGSFTGTLTAQVEPHACLYIEITKPQ